MKGIVSKSVMKKDRERFCRSLDYTLVAGKTNPYALLAAAVIAPAAIDCSEYKPEFESPEWGRTETDVMLRRFYKLREFINSDWIDLLLSWQNQVTPEAVCEELVRRLKS